jgi:hypothetical protein
MINWARRIVCCDEAEDYAVGSLATSRVSQAGQVSAVEPDRVSQNKVVGKAA